jgi:type II secretory pathway component PulF
MATFAEVLSLLIQQDVPLPEAVTLAANASGDGGLGKAAEKLAERLRSGEMEIRREDIPAEIPPLLAWQIFVGANQPGLARSLALTAGAYRQQAIRSARWNAFYLPILLTVTFGGAATLLQGLVVFGPICRLLYELS